MALRFALIVSVFALLFFAYPVWRLTAWLGFDLWVQITCSLLAFGSQYIVRFGLRKVDAAWVFPLRTSIDLLLGLAPVLLLSVLVGEAIVALGGETVQVAWAILLFVCLVVVLGVVQKAQRSLPQDAKIRF